MRNNHSDPAERISHQAVTDNRHSGNAGVRTLGVSAHPLLAVAWMRWDPSKPPPAPSDRWCGQRWAGCRRQRRQSPTAASGARRDGYTWHSSPLILCATSLAS